VLRGPSIAAFKNTGSAMSHKKIHLKDVTLVTVTSVHIQDTLAALMYCLKGIEFGAVKFISHSSPHALPSEVEFCPCPKIQSLEEYSRFMIYHLNDYIATPYCLTIQRDGVVVHPKLWSDEFLNFDYIGAPWPIDNAFKANNGKYVRVGNGGFSLRSKKLLALGKEKEIPFASSTGLVHEDVFICVENGEEYESAGIRFADIETAAKFSREFILPETRWVTPFGFHKHRALNRFFPRFPSQMTMANRAFKNLLLKRSPSQR
jgi:hypothetical protein